MFSIDDLVVRTVPDTGQGCIGIIREVVFQDSFSREDFGYALVEITEGNIYYPVGSVTSWFLGSMELVS